MTTTTPLPAPPRTEAAPPCAAPAAVAVPLLLAGSGGPQPVAVGVPFPRGTLANPDGARLLDPAGRAVPVQTAALARWPDGSVKWLLLDFVPGPAAGGRWLLRATQDADPPAPATALRVTESRADVGIDTGAATFHLDRTGFTPFSRVLLGGAEVLDGLPARFVLGGAPGPRVAPRLERAGVTVEARGPVRATVCFRGGLGGRKPLRFVLRCCFFAGTGLVRLRLTVHNPNPARHPGGLWDLGDAGSVLFRDLSLELGLAAKDPPRTLWKEGPGLPWRSLEAGSLEIYQDSSGGANWQSRNHVNAKGAVPCAFRGYRVRAGGREETGLRASPVVALRGAAAWLTAAVPEFWQQFPKAIHTEGATVRLGLFPEQFGDAFELQGGEQKTHTVWLHFGPPGGEAPPLEWVHEPAHARADPEWYAASGAVPWLSQAQGLHPVGSEILAEALAGPNSLFARREVIDEYGWRHYGELYADHEAAHCPAPPPVVSHYNNQYDVLFGALLQYWRSGDARWQHLLDPLARHVLDIDIYHTGRDKSAYSGGLFWHTDHYKGAATCTHRGYSRANQKPGQPYGGGPSNEHNYTTGLLHFHYLTGDPAARDAVLGLADWVLRRDDGRRTVFGLVDDGPTGLASCTRDPDYHGPGRGAGNSVNALLDAWLLSGGGHYLDAAEGLIRRCVHPHDDVATRDLLRAEERWSYTVFLAVLARYLDLKAEAGQLDAMAAYGRASLLAYAAWMAEHERPYFDRPEQLEYPTETWAAQELRKANVLRLAARHADEPLRARLLARGAAFAERAWSDVQRFPSRGVTRSLAILLTEATKDAWLHGQPGDAPRPSGDHRFPPRKEFVPQRRRVFAQIKTPRGLARAVVRLADPRRWFRFAACGLAGRADPKNESLSDAT